MHAWDVAIYYGRHSDNELMLLVASVVLHFHYHSQKDIAATSVNIIAAIAIAIAAMATIIIGLLKG